MTLFTIYGNLAYINLSSIFNGIHGDVSSEVLPTLGGTSGFILLLLTLNLLLKKKQMYKTLYTNCVNKIILFSFAWGIA